MIETTQGNVINVNVKSLNINTKRAYANHHCKSSVLYRSNDKKIKIHCSLTSL